MSIIKTLNIVFKCSKNKEKSLPHEVIFVFIRYFLGAILLKKSCQKRGDWKKDKKGEWSYRGTVYERGVLTLRTLCEFMF